MRNSCLGTVAVLFLSAVIVLREGQCQAQNGEWGIPNGNMQNWGIPNGDMQNWGIPNGNMQNWGIPNGDWGSDYNGQWSNQNNWQNWKNKNGGNKWNKIKKEKKSKKDNNNWAANWQKLAGIGNGATGTGNSQWLKMAEQYMSQWRNNNGAVPSNGKYEKKTKMDNTNNGNGKY